MMLFSEYRHRKKSKECVLKADMREREYIYVNEMQTVERRGDTIGCSHRLVVSSSENNNRHDIRRKVKIMPG
jgi:hypothetical protein